MGTDAQFGPVMLFGQGGTAVEVIDDKALAVPPLDPVLAEAMMAQTRVHRLLQGYRDRTPAALGVVAACLIRLSQPVIDIAAACEVDINLLLDDSQGGIAHDARISHAASHHGVGSAHTSIQHRHSPKFHARTPPALL